MRVFLEDYQIDNGTYVVTLQFAEVRDLSEARIAAGRRVLGR